MKRMKKTLYMCLLTVLFLFCGRMTADAAEQTVTVYDEDETDITLTVGDTGKIELYTSGDTYDEYGYYIGASLVQISGSYTWSDNDCMTLQTDGTFTATAPGTMTVEVYGYDSAGESVSATIYFTVNPDMTNVTLASSSETVYLLEDYYDTLYSYSWYSGTFTIAVNSTAVLSEDDGLSVSCASSNEDVSAYASLQENVLTVTVAAEGKASTTLTISIGGKDFTVDVTLTPVKLSSYGCLLAKGQTKTLKLKGYSGTVTWKSSNTKVATVSKKGVVKAKKTGNVIISAQIGDQKLGCAVSVTTATLKKVCTRATSIGTNWTYSQAKRAQSGYYDCSALVWKAYTKYTKINFGSSAWPGTTKTESAWCKSHGKILKGGYTYAKECKMKYQPGDIVFKSTDLDDPYNTVYHVEMITGYVCLGFDSSGQANVALKWASRGVGYGAEDGSLIARPSK